MSADSQRETPPGPLGSIRRLLHTVLLTLQSRVELIAIELREEKCRAVELLLWCAAAIFLAVIAVVVLTVAIAFLVGESARPYVLLGAGILYVAGAVGAFFVARRKLTSGPAPFEETVSQLKKDREWLKSHKES